MTSIMNLILSPREEVAKYVPGLVVYKDTQILV